VFGLQPGIKRLVQQEARSSRPILTTFFPLYRCYSRPSYAPSILAFATCTFAVADHFEGNLLTGSQPAHSDPESPQRAWLKYKYPQFLDHQANKTISRFFPSLYEEYFSQWPPTPTEEEVSEAGGNIAVATAIVRQIEEHVRDFELTALIGGGLIVINRGSTAGCTTVPVRSAAE